MPDNRQHQRSFSNGPRPIESAPGFMPATSAFDMWGPVISNMQAWTRQMTQCSATLQHEWLSFVEKRLKQDAILGQQLAECKGPDEIMRTYSEFMRTAFEDYQREFTTFAKLSGTMTSDALGTLQAGEGKMGAGEADERASASSPAGRKRQGTHVGTEH
jgi:hypothetical protein